MKEEVVNVCVDNSCHRSASRQHPVIIG